MPTAKKQTTKKTAAKKSAAKPLKINVHQETQARLDEISKEMVKLNRERAWLLVERDSIAAKIRLKID